MGIPNAHTPGCRPLKNSHRAGANFGNARKCRCRVIRLFLSAGGTVLHAIWQLPTIDIIEFTRVGTHNNAPDFWVAVRKLMATIALADPFDVVFADEAGLDVRFVAPIAPERARFIDRFLLDQLVEDCFWGDSYLVTIEEARRLGLTSDPEADDRGGEAVAAFIATGRLRLWWD